LLGAWPKAFVEVADRFPEQCRYVLESLAVVYRNDAIAHQRKLSPRASALSSNGERPGDGGTSRLAWPQLEDRLAEPNRRWRGDSYMLKHWEADPFLARPGAPLDNNVCERALKRAILHRKNALFYRPVAARTLETCL